MTDDQGVRRHPATSGIGNPSENGYRPERGVRWSLGRHNTAD
jgi:hypothetical protein